MQPWYISVDVEAAGPIPGRYALLSIGACTVEAQAETFYAELQPERDAVDADAMAVSGLSMERLAREGEPAARALARFARWIEDLTPPGHTPVMVAFNAPFDWMFVADALHRHTGGNPFGHSALDVKALDMGVSAVPWGDTSFAAIAARYGIEAQLPHHAREDACLQAEVFRRILGALRSGRVHDG